MVRTRSRLRNHNQPLESHVVEHAQAEVPTQEELMMVGVQAMIQIMMSKQREKMKQLIYGNGREPKAPIEQPELNMEQIKEGNYNQIVRESQAKKG